MADPTPEPRNQEVVENDVPAEDSTRTLLSLEASSASLSDRTPARQLDDTTLIRYVQELEATLAESSFFGLVGPDQRKVERLLEPLSQADRKEIERLYDANKGIRGALRWDLYRNFGATDGIRIGSILDRQDGRTNDAGALLTAIARMRTDPQRGNADIANLLKGLSKANLDQMDADLRRQPSTAGLGLREILQREDMLSPVMREAIFGRDGRGGLLLKGADRRTANDVADLARFALEKGDRDLFLTAISGDTDQTRLARHALQRDGEFMEKVARTFPGNILSRVNPFNTRPEDWMDPIVRDFLKHGNISLETVVSENFDHGNLRRNWANIELAFKSATDQERQTYGPRFREVFGRLGTEAEVSALEDLFWHGRPTLISNLANTHQRFALDPFGFTASHSRQDLFSKVENITEADWNLMRDPEKGRRFMELLDGSLARYATPQERTQIMDYVRQMAAQNSFGDARRIGRSVADAITDNTSSRLFGLLGERTDVPRILERMANMSPQEAEERRLYREYMQRDSNRLGIGRGMTLDDRMRGIIERQTKVDNFINGLGPVEQTYARRLLDQVERTGRPPELSESDKILRDYVHGARPRDALKQIERAMQDPEFRERMTSPSNYTDQIQRWIIERTIKQATEFKIDVPYGGPRVAVPSDVAQGITQRFLETGRFSLPDKIQLGYHRRDIIEAAVSAPPIERMDPIARRYIRPQEREILDRATRDSNGRLSLEDRLRIFVVTGMGSPREFENELKNLTNAQKQDLQDNYTRKYDSILSTDFLSQVKDRGLHNLYTNYLTPSGSDGRQDVYNNRETALYGQKGFVVDGTQLTLLRASQIQDAMKERYQNIPPEIREQMNKIFGEAHRQMLDSKERLATTVAMLATGLAMTAGIPPMVAIPLGVAVKNIFIYMNQGARDYDRDMLPDRIFDGVVQSAIAIFANDAIIRTVRGASAGRVRIATDITANGFALAFIASVPDQIKNSLLGTEEDRITVRQFWRNFLEDLRAQDTRRPIKFQDRLPN